MKTEYPTKNIVSESFGTMLLEAYLNFVIGLLTILLIDYRLFVALLSKVPEPDILEFESYVIFINPKPFYNFFFFFVESSSLKHRNTMATCSS